MLEFYLEDRVHKFIREFEIVHINQVYRFFRDEHKGTVKRVLMNLEHEGFITTIMENYVSVHKTLPTDIANYSDRFKAIYVMCALESREIKWFTLDEFPMEILFVNNDGVCYAVTVFNARNWSTKYALIKKFQSRSLVKGMPDPINYIAVVPSEDLIPKVRDLNFAHYALIDNNGSSKFLHDDSEE